MLIVNLGILKPELGEKRFYDSFFILCSSDEQKPEELTCDLQYFYKDGEKVMSVKDAIESADFYWQTITQTPFSTGKRSIGEIARALSLIDEVSMKGYSTKILTDRDWQAIGMRISLSSLTQAERAYWKAKLESEEYTRFVYQKIEGSSQKLVALVFSWENIEELIKSRETEPKTNVTTKRLLEQRGSSAINIGLQVGC